ncbi:unnamed protein product [Cylindrotheca closterium]|uniref:Protein kinase domain-containing protein n=1 Tax=Cylindrotheca closterium TaxID=2856 RepID=A0AAD2CKH9_9STRA|nr:unnamed protein product [Cylindrotheca closterium]
MSTHDDELGKSTIGNRVKLSDHDDVPEDDERDHEAHEKARHSATKTHLELMRQDSVFFTNRQSSSLPAFESKEVSLGSFLGQGEFGAVYSIAAFHVEDDEDNKVDDDPATTPTPELSVRNNKDTPTSPKSERDPNGKEESNGSNLLRKSSSILDSQSSGIIGKPSSNSKFGRKDSNVSFAQNPDAVIFQGDEQDSAEYDDSSLSGDDDDDDDDGEIGSTAENSKRSSPRKVPGSNLSKGYMSSHVMRNGKPRYAIKRLRKDLKGEKLMYATSDFASEARFLMSLRHPNICRMRGTISEPGKKDFAIILDRLTMTLRDKMLEWKKEDSSGSLFSKLERLIHHPKDKQEEEIQVQKERFAQKLLALYDTARALRFLAKNSIIFRDLKPENLAYDVRGDVRLFDFGLAKELKEKDKDVKDKYRLTGLTGSRRYMAPEVIMCKDYGLPADVYSFAIMFWEVMSNHNAYCYLTNEKHNEMVVILKKRPNLKKMIPHQKHVLPEGSQIHDLVEQSWAPNPDKRPTIESLCDMLCTEVMKASETNDDDDEGGLKVGDRTAFLINESIRSRSGVG